MNKVDNELGEESKIDLILLEVDNLDEIRRRETVDGSAMLQVIMSMHQS